MVEKIFIISFIVFAIWYTYQEGEIFGALGKWFEKHLPEKLHQPVYECPVCMGGIYGAILYWLIWGNSIKEWLIVNIAVIGLNAILNKLFPPGEIEIKDE